MNTAIKYNPEMMPAAWQLKTDLEIMNRFPERSEYTQDRKSRYPGENITQMHLARKGILTEEIQIAALRENLHP